MEVVKLITRWVVQILVVLITIMLIYSLAEFIFILGKAVIAKNGAFTFSLDPIDRNGLFIGHVQGLISAVLLLTILIELISSLLEYLKVGGANYVTVITEIALIAIVRHLLSIDFEHVETNVLLGLSALIFVLGGFYLITSRRILSTFERKKDQSSDDRKN